MSGGSPEPVCWPIRRLGSWACMPVPPSSCVPPPPAGGFMVFLRAEALCVPLVLVCFGVAISLSSCSECLQMWGHRVVHLGIALLARGQRELADSRIAIVDGLHCNGPRSC